MTNRGAAWLIRTLVFLIFVWLCFIILVWPK